MASRLALDEAGADVFISHEPTDPMHVFGGLVVAQALRAAALTVPAGRSAHALHASFVVRGTGGEPIRYSVERTRDGGSFATRRVTAAQDHGVVLVLTADFHDDEDGLEYESPATSGIPGPDGLPQGRYDSPWFESRDVPVDDAPPTPQHARRAWFRPTAPLPDDPDLHLQALAYLSDHGPTRAAREPHAALADDARRMSVSLDHSLWFHRPVRLDDWVLVEFVPQATGRGRGLSLGTARDRNGTLLATIAQEVLLRSR